MQTYAPPGSDMVGPPVAVNVTAPDGSVVRQGSATTISGPMRQNDASVSTSRLHAGTAYACQFTFDGAVVAEKQFTVAGYASCSMIAISSSGL